MRWLMQDSKNRLKCQEGLRAQGGDDSIDNEDAEGTHGIKAEDGEGNGEGRKECDKKGSKEGNEEDDADDEEAEHREVVERKESLEAEPERGTGAATAANDNK